MQPSTLFSSTGSYAIIYILCIHLLSSGYVVVHFIKKQTLWQKLTKYKPRTTVINGMYKKLRTTVKNPMWWWVNVHIN